MNIGIDNYGLLPLGLSPMETLNWAHKNGAAGVAFSGLPNRPNHQLDLGLLMELKTHAAAQGLYLEWGGGQHFPLDMTLWNPKDIRQLNRVVADEAAILGTDIVRSCSGGLMRWNRKSPPTQRFVELLAGELLFLLPILKDLQIQWAIETHFELTSFELLKAFELADLQPGDGIGICLDTMNLITMLEQPLAATQRLLPWVISTHIKDGGILRSDQDLISFPAAIGRGSLPLKTIIEMVTESNPDINLNIEDHNGSFLLPVSEAWFIKEFPDISESELQSLYTLAEENEPKRAMIETEFFDRESWPKLCEQRMAGDLSALKKLLN